MAFPSASALLSLMLISKCFHANMINIILAKHLASSSQNPLETRDFVLFCFITATIFLWRHTQEEELKLHSAMVQVV